MHADAEDRGELPMKVKLREACALAQLFSGEALLKVRINIFQHP
jgi:hypothetical protein